MAKLAIDLLGFERGKAYGFEEYILNILSDFKLYREKIDVEDIILVVRDTQEVYFRDCFGDFYHLKTLKCNSMKDRLLLSRKIPQLLDLYKSDIILYPGNSMPLSRKCTKTVLVIHDLLYLHGDFFQKDLHSLLFRAHRYIYIPRSLKQADKVIAISNFTKDEIIQAYGISSSKISAIYNYFSFDKYKKDEQSIDNINYPYILTICSRAKHKNHITWLKAFEKFSKHYPIYKYVFVGSFSDEAQEYFNNMLPEIKEKIVRMSHLTNNDIGYLYSNAKMFVSASLYEGLGMPVVESIYFGLPTLLSDIDVHHEVSMDQAYYFSPLSSDDLCTLMLKVAKGKGRTRNDIDKKVLIDKYSSENTSLKYISVINSLITNNLEGKSVLWRDFRNDNG